MCFTACQVYSYCHVTYNYICSSILSQESIGSQINNQLSQLNLYLVSHTGKPIKLEKPSVVVCTALNWLSGATCSNIQERFKFVNRGQYTTSWNIDFRIFIKHFFTFSYLRFKMVKAMFPISYPPLSSVVCNISHGPGQRWRWNYWPHPSSCGRHHC